MWIEELDNGKFKYVERYKDPYSDKYRKVSVTLKSNSNRAQNTARRELQEKIQKKINNVNKTDKTIGDMLEVFWAKYPPTVKDTTVRRVKSTHKLIKDELPPQYKLDKIDTPFLQNIVDKIYYEDEYSTSTTKQVKFYLNQLFTRAKKEKFVDYNPALELEIKLKPIQYEDIEKIEDKFLEREELRAVIDNLRYKRKHERYADFTEFMSLTGPRFGECIGIWLQNYFKEYVEIDGTIDYQTKRPHENYKTTPKNNSSFRRVDLQERAQEICEKIIFENKLSHEVTETTPLFTNAKGYPLELSSYNRMLKRVAKECGIQKNVTSHILRHTHISMLAEEGFDLKSIMSRVGHSKPETTLKIYTHVTNKMRVNNVSKLNAIKF